MLSSIFKHRISFFLLIALFVCGAPLASAQTTEFTYQGNLVDNSIPANGNYDFEFRLFAVMTDGVPIGARTRLNVPVSNGVFTVRLDFAAAGFTGADRFLEIAVKPAGSPNPSITLLPRQPITFAPYSFHSLNADIADTATMATNSLQLGGVAANQFVVTGDSRLSDARNPLPGSGSYIQSGTTQQSGIINFNISGNGILGGVSANTVNATTQYNIGNNRVLSVAGADNTFVGLGAGTDNDDATFNSFFGRNAGHAITYGTENSFFGARAGFASIGGYLNSFFGSDAGEDNVYGLANSFFGGNAGNANTYGDYNSFFGAAAGSGNTNGSKNTFVGTDAGINNTTGNNNTLIGNLADVGSSNLNYATAIGAGAEVSNSNTIVLGRSSGSDYVLIPGFLTIPNLAVAGNENLCRNSFDRVGSCSSSLRYKTNLQPFTGGLNIINRLRPITFTWKDGGMRDVGLGAEDVEKIEPLLVTRNRAGEIEGVKYGQISSVLINAVKEQQTEIELLQQQVKSQQRQIDALNKLVCQSHPDSDICK